LTRNGRGVRIRAVMTATQVLVFAFLIGFFAGLRSLTAPAVTAWAAHLDWLKVPSPLSWMGTATAAILFTLFALVELVTDKLPKTPSRTAPPGLICADRPGRVERCVRRFGRGSRHGGGRGVGDFGRARGHVWRIPGAHAIGEVVRDAGFRDCDSGRSGDDWRVVVGCFAVLRHFLCRTYGATISFCGVPAFAGWTHLWRAAGAEEGQAKKEERRMSALI